jgi:ABC-type transport system involved in multi-copper enzyme maturation permease subunit
MLISIFIGIGLVYKELEKRTVYALLSKPVHRYELILGKYLGLLFTILVNLAIMTAGLEIALMYTGKAGVAAYVRIFPAAYLIFLSLALVTALALLFSTFSTPALSAVFTFFLWIAGHFGRDLLNFGALTKSALVQWICRVFYYVIPNLANFNLIDSRGILRSGPWNQAIDLSAIGWASLYCVLYCAVVVSFSASIFMRRDFK